MTCKFCGCTDSKPCAIPICEGPGLEPMLATDSNVAIGVMPCGWLIDDPAGPVCTAPACVEKAYEEAALLASQLEFFIGRSA
jgi:hypothetical protein